MEKVNARINSSFEEAKPNMVFGAQARRCEAHFLQISFQSQDSTRWLDQELQGAAGSSWILTIVWVGV